jgi:hypothetical protein
MVIAQRLRSTSTTTIQLAFAFDYDSSGKQDHLVYYSPGTGNVTIIKKNQDGTFTKLYPLITSGLGFGDKGGIDFTLSVDRVIPFDYSGIGKADHLLCYRPGNGDSSGKTSGAVSILQNNKDGTFTAVFTSTNGIGGCSLSDYNNDQIIAYDYTGTGQGSNHLDHLVCYRPGASMVWILQNQNGNFSSVYVSNSNGVGPGIGGFDLASPNDQIITYDYGSTGHLDHLICYRPGEGAIFILENDNGTFKPKYQQGDPGQGISKFDLSKTEDRILAYDYSGTGCSDHLVCYRPGTGLIYILQNQSGTFSPVYNPDGATNGIGSYSLQSPDDVGFTFDYDSIGHQNYLVFYRPGDDAMPATS